MKNIRNNWSFQVFKVDGKLIQTGNLSRAKYFTIIRSNSEEGDVYVQTYEFDKGLNPSQKKKQIKATIASERSNYSKRKERKNKDLESEILKDLERIIRREELEVIDKILPQTSFYSNIKKATFNEITISTLFSPEIKIPESLDVAINHLIRISNKLLRKLQKKEISKKSLYIRSRAVVCNPDDTEKSRVVSTPSLKFKSVNHEAEEMRSLLVDIIEERQMRENYAHIFNLDNESAIMGFEVTFSWEVMKGNALIRQG